MAELENLVPKICARGVRSFKGFMAYKKRGMYLSDADLLGSWSTLKDNGGLFCVHAENGDLCDFLEEGFTAAGKTGPEYYGPSRPGITEAEAVFRILSFAKIARMSDVRRPCQHPGSAGSDRHVPQMELRHRYTRRPARTTSR